MAAIAQQLANIDWVNGTTWRVPGNALSYDPVPHAEYVISAQEGVNLERPDLTAEYERLVKGKHFITTIRTTVTALGRINPQSRLTSEAEALAFAHASGLVGPNGRAVMWVSYKVLRDSCSRWNKKMEDLATEAAAARLGAEMAQAIDLTAIEQWLGENM